MAAAASALLARASSAGTHATADSWVNSYVADYDMDGGESPALHPSEDNVAGVVVKQEQEQEPYLGDSKITVSAKSEGSSAGTRGGSPPVRDTQRKPFPASFQEDCEAGGRIGIEIRKKNEPKYREDCRIGGIKGANSKRNLRHTSLKTFLLSAAELGLSDIARPVSCPKPGCNHSVMLKFVDLGWASERNLMAHEEDGDGEEVDYEPDIRLVIQTCNVTSGGKKCGGRFAKPDWWDGGTIDYSTLDVRLKRNGLVEKATKREINEDPPARATGSGTRGATSSPPLFPSPTTATFPSSAPATFSLPVFDDPLNEFFDFSGVRDELEAFHLANAEFAHAASPATERDDPMDVSSPPRPSSSGNVGRASSSEPPTPPAPPPYLPFFSLPPLPPTAGPSAPPSSGSAAGPSGRARRVNSLPIAVPPPPTITRSLSTSARRRVSSPSRPGAPYPILPPSPSLSPSTASPLSAATDTTGRSVFDFTLPPQPNMVFEMVMRELTKGVPPLRHAAPGDGQGGDATGLPPMFAPMGGLQGHFDSHMGDPGQASSENAAFSDPNHVFEMVMRELAKGIPQLRHADPSIAATTSATPQLDPFDLVLAELVRHPPPLRPAPHPPAPADFTMVLTELVRKPPPLRRTGQPRVTPAHRGPAQYETVMREMITRPPVLRTPGRMRGGGGGSGSLGAGGVSYAPAVPSPLGGQGASGAGQHRRTSSGAVRGVGVAAAGGHGRTTSTASGGYDPMDPFTHLNLGAPGLSGVSGTGVHGEGMLNGTTGNDGGDVYLLPPSEAGAVHDGAGSAGHGAVGGSRDEDTWMEMVEKVAMMGGAEERAGWNVGV
ncbi:hypothetical protein M427DRAFT_70560 [Gonapodya prolifera JEL478]|uniref:Uncharacterized protein n=1 Tax=Gonapodya prolifera (strain JEL478) TaxID=1344416 RepID=A0A139ACT2_GONPJ|nr:hypothetical protein M427DRAFT_70560 [Gonapodya prolifera JEL478]|eukprot:KXS14558.1 hypothetical protein M427DRAFT_70560 [Gonapodya prolifera JEL478]